MAYHSVNHTFNDSSSAISQSRLGLFFLAIDLLIATTSIVVNIITLTTIFCCKRLYTIPNTFIASLAFSNIIQAGANVLSWSMNAKSVLLHCISLYFRSSSTTCSLCNHSMISVERWMYIARPYLYQRVVTHGAAVVGVVTSWLISLLACTYILIFCSVNTHYDNSKIFYCLILPCIHFALSATMIAVYGHIAVITKRQIKAIYKRVDAANRLKSVRQSWKQVRMLVIVFGTYFCLLSPSVFMNLYVYGHGIGLQFYDTNVANGIAMIYYFNSFANFFIYSLLDREFRHKLTQWGTGILLAVSCAKVHPLDGGA